MTFLRTYVGVVEGGKFSSTSRFGYLCHREFQIFCAVLPLSQNTKLVQANDWN